MANVSFVRTEPDNLPDQAIDYLFDACDAIKGYCTVEMAIAQTQAGIGCIHCVWVDNVLCGCLFINFRIVEGEKKMTLVLLGCQPHQFHIWANDLIYFLRCVKRDQKASNFSILARKGFGRMFKELRHVACVFEGE